MKLCFFKVGKMNACIRPLFANSVTNYYIANNNITIELTFGLVGIHAITLWCHIKNIALSVITNQESSNFKA